MKRLLQKISVIFITFMTLGLYIPPTYLNIDAAENKEVITPKAKLSGDTLNASEDESNINDSFYGDLDEEELSTSDHYINVLTEQAREQTVTKLGPRIFQHVEADLEKDILPNIEEVISMILKKSGDDEVPYYGISEELTPGYGEKIFNLYDLRTNKNIAKFHVRRDNRPGEGYWFNFHYHLSNDGFEEHHTIGEIYWDKNTPPKWMS